MPQTSVFCMNWLVLRNLEHLADARPKVLSGSTFSSSSPELFDSVGLTASETQRYSRYLVLRELGPEGQRRLKRSSVLVVGLRGWISSRGLSRVHWSRPALAAGMSLLFLLLLGLQVIEVVVYSLDLTYDIVQLGLISSWAR